MSKSTPLLNMADASCVPASINNSDASARANPGRYSAINAEASTILRELREYQQRTVGLARAEYAAGRRAVVAQLPTGAGKTIVMSELARLGIAKGNRILIVVPLLELLEQTVSKLNDAGITDIRIIQADNDLGNPDASVVVASIQTLTTKRWMENPIQADLVIVDECHHGKARTHEQFLKLYAGAKLLGLTATVQRGDGQGLGDIFGALVVGATVKELQDLGHLVPCKVYAPSKILGSRELAQDPVDAYEQRTPGKKAIVFCSTVEHARKTAESFQQRGHRAKWVSGDSPDRTEIVQQFKRRDFDVLVNVSLFVEGFDDPETEVAILARRFTHVGSYLQALGRILRPFPGKTSATAIDLCGSALVHGTPDLERSYSLDGKGISTERQPIRQCQECGGVFVSASAQSCPFCEFKLPALTRAQAKALGIRLEEVTAATKPTSWPMRAKRRGFCSSCRGLVMQGEWIVYSAASKQALHTRCASRAQRSQREVAA